MIELLFLLLLYSALAIVAYGAAWVIGYVTDLLHLTEEDRP